MTDDFTTDALDYLLDQMDPVRRAAFAAHLARDPVAASAFKTCADGFAQFAQSAAPAEPLAPAVDGAALAAILAVAESESAARRTRAKLRIPKYFWPIAAAILLGLNVTQYALRAKSGAPRAIPKSVTPQATSIKGEGGHRSAAPDAREAEAVVSVNPIPAKGGSDIADVAAENHRLQELRTEHAALLRARESLRSEYNSIIRQLSQRALVEKGVSRMAAMELVDPASYAKGERKGLIDLARGLLTQPGIVAIEGANRPPPVANSDPFRTEPVDLLPVTVSGIAGELGMGAVSFTGATSMYQPPFVAVSGANSFAAETPGIVNTPLPSAGGNSPTVAPTQNATPIPYAWSVFDELERKGYLNLYNLPVVPADQTLQLWIKPVDSGAYQRVGEVPAQFYGGAGSLYYRLPDTTGTPVEILITQEPRSGGGVEPTGPTILRGP